MADMNFTQNTLSMNGELAGLDFDDDQYEEEAQETPTPDWEGEDGTPEEEQQTEDTWLSMLLRDKGIQDPTKIKFADDEDNIQERDWNSLSDEEKYNILMQQEPSSEEEESSDLTDEEIELINTIRENNLTPTEYFNSVIQNQLRFIYGRFETQNSRYN